MHKKMRNKVKLLPSIQNFWNPVPQPTMTMEVALAGAIKSSLSNHLTANAIFLAERLHAENVNEFSMELLALANIQGGHYAEVVDLLRDSVGDRNRFAQTALWLKWS